MIDLYKIIEACDACNTETCRLQIITFILEHTNAETGLFERSYDDISKATGICYATVVRTMKKLKDQRLIERVADGEWKWMRQMFEVESHEEEDPEEVYLHLRNYCED